MGELHGGARACARVHVRAAAWMKAAFDCQTTHDRRPVLRCRPANAVIPPSGRRRVPPFACWFGCFTSLYQHRPTWGPQPAGAKQPSPWREWYGAVRRGGAQPRGSGGTCSNSGILGEHVLSPVVETIDDVASQSAGESATMLPSNPERCEAALLHQQPSIAIATQ